jgi:hypothetical protein
VDALLLQRGVDVGLKISYDLLLFGYRSTNFSGKARSTTMPGPL